VARIADRRCCCCQTVAELEALGVTRASTASAVSLMAMTTTRQVAEELRRAGKFDALAPAFAQADAQRLFADLA
jgi:2-methylisocitrate lyase-like PEP mutase family enzyme